MCNGGLVSYASKKPTHCNGWACFVRDRPSLQVPDHHRSLAPAHRRGHAVRRDGEAEQPTDLPAIGGALESARHIPKAHRPVPARRHQGLPSGRKRPGRWEPRDRKSCPQGIPSGKFHRAIRASSPLDARMRPWGRRPKERIQSVWHLPSDFSQPSGRPIAGSYGRGWQ